MTFPTTRRRVLLGATAAAASSALPFSVSAAERRYEPQQGGWRTFDLATRITLPAAGPATVWIPLPSVESDWQRSVSEEWTGNAATAQVRSDTAYGARMLVARFDNPAAVPDITVTARVQTRGRTTDWSARPRGVAARAEDLRPWLAPTELMPTDGIVRETARKATEGARTDVEKVRKLYDWVVACTFRDPKVRGCGTGDVRAMMAMAASEMSGKCADINGLFVALVRAAGIPARDAYGVRVAPSAFGYRELGGTSAQLKGAQHCRAEVHLAGRGWVPMDPADVTKVMRQETPEWIRDSKHPLVAPVNKGLFGAWEGNWVAYNMAHDVALPGSTKEKLGFLMYPQAETAAGRADSLDPDKFRYTIAARELA